MQQSKLSKVSHKQENHLPLSVSAIYHPKNHQKSTTMESINTLKGYDKVGDKITDLEDQQFIHKKNPTNRKPLIIVIPTIILAAVILCLAATTLLHRTTTKSNLTNQESISNSIRTVCNATSHLESCITSLQNSSTDDPEMLFKLYLNLSLAQLNNLVSLPQQLLVKVNDPRVKSALLDCQGLFSDAVDQVGSCMSEMKVRPGEKMLTAVKINDMNTWISAAMTNLETCMDGLDEMDSSVHKEMEDGMTESKVYLSNSLAIVAKIGSVLDELHIPMH